MGNQFFIPHLDPPGEYYKMVMRCNHSATSDETAKVLTARPPIKRFAIWFLCLSAMCSCACQPQPPQPRASPAPTAQPNTETRPAENAQGKIRANDDPPVVKLYIDSQDIEEVIESNMRIRATDYGFQIANSRSAADVVLAGSAGVLKREGFPFDSCTAFYGFDVVGRRSRRGKSALLLRLSLGVPNDFPCVRLAVANRVLSELRDGLDRLEPSPKK